jgi:uncharacterized membrane protein
MEYLILIFLHIFCGIIWAGSAVAIGLFVVPSLMEAGPAAGAVMAGVARRRLPIVLMIVASIVLLTGLRLYMLRFSPYWVTTTEGLVLTLGGLLAIAAFIMGVFVQRPLAARMGQLSAQIAASGAPPTPGQASELQAMRTRLRRSAAVIAWHLLGAAALMASHRLAIAW